MQLCLLILSSLMVYCLGGIIAPKYNIKDHGKNMDPNKPLYREMSTEALNLYLRLRPDPKPYKTHRVGQVERVTTQTVWLHNSTGLLTRISFTAIKNCRRLLDNHCKVTVPVDLTCGSEFIEQPLIDEASIKVSCDQV